jgi:MFS family permease
MLINAFLWYYLTLSIMAIISRSINVEQTEFLPFHSLGVIIGGIAGLFFSKNRCKILFLWTFLGVATSLLPLLTFISTLMDFQLICFAWGFSFGLGMPICLAYFAENTAIENRGRLSGIVLLTSLFCAIPLTSLTHLFGLSTSYLLLGFWRLLGFVSLLILRNECKKFKFKMKSVVSTVHNSRLYLYLVPWLMFNVVDSLEGLLLRDFVKATFPEYYALLQLISLLFASIFAFLSGFLCDLVGRKPVTIFGFAVMGIVYAVISITPTSLPVWSLFFICDGFSWGLFYMIFIMVIWGDLAPKGLEEKYYLVGNIPLFLAAIIQKFFAGYVRLLSEVNAFSLAAILLFLAVIPLMYAPETLPEKAIRERELRSYIEKAKKIKEKFT